MSDIAGVMRTELSTILNLEVPIIVRIAEKQMPLDEVLTWVPGMILDLGRSADEELELLANNVPVGAGMATKIGENFGIRMTFVGDLKARIEAFQPRFQPLSVQSVGGYDDDADLQVDDNAEAQAVIENVISGAKP